MAIVEAAEEDSMEKRFITASVVKEEMKARSGLGTISSEALDWVNEQISAILDVCAKTGRRTPGGRLMAPAPATPATDTPSTPPAS